MSGRWHHRKRMQADYDWREQALVATVDAALAGVVFLLPFCMGGRQALGQFVLVVLATVLAAAWTARQALLPQPQWRHTPAQWLLLAAAVLVVVQLLPLPAACIAWISPETPRMLPLWNSASGDAPLGQWNRLSLAPEATRQGLVQLLAYAAIFLVAVQRLADLRDIERLLRWLACSAVAMACFGLAQYLFSNGKFFWVYEHPFVSTADSVRGAFTNRNHFAHFLALGLPPLLWWLHCEWSGRRDTAASRRFGLLALALCLVLFAALLSRSRGGAVAVAAATGVCAIIGWKSSILSLRFLLVLGGTASLVFAMLLVHGYQDVAGRLDDFTAGSVDALDPTQGRRKVWNAVLAAAADFPLLGTGVGTHVEVYPRYMSEFARTEYTHAESGYLQVLEETGVAGLALLFCGIGFCTTWCVGVLRRAERSLSAAVAAVAGSLAASALHSLYDFVWYVPACMAPAALLAASLFRLHGLAGTAPQATCPVSRSGRWAWGLASAAILLAGVIVSSDRAAAIPAEHHWDRYLLASRTPADPQLQADRMVECFTAIVRYTPSNARAHLALAEAYLRRFDQAQQQSENPLGLTAVRDAAQASQLGAAEVRDWLQRALGRNYALLEKALWHTQEALDLCPLQAQGYLYLAELRFLNPEALPESADLIQQALAVRPYDGGVLFKAGEEAALAGNFAQAAQYWRRALRTGPFVCEQMIDFLASRGFPLSAVLEHLAPDLPALRVIQQKYRGVAAEAEYRRLLQQTAAAASREAGASTGTKAAALWLEAHKAAVQADDLAAATRWLNQSLRADANFFPTRIAAGYFLLRQHRFAEAEEHIKWCLARKANDPQLRSALELAAKGRIDTQTQASRAAPPRS